MDLPTLKQLRQEFLSLPTPPFGLVSNKYGATINKFGDIYFIENDCFTLEIWSEGWHYFKVDDTVVDCGPDFAGIDDVLHLMISAYHILIMSVKNAV